MRIAITGGTGFVGMHVAERFEPADVVAISRRTGVDVDDVDALTAAFGGCDVIVHAAGINREMTVPLVATAQVRMLAEGVSEPWGDVDELPDDLRPTTRFTDEAILAAMPPRGGFGWKNLRVAR